MQPSLPSQAGSADQGFTLLEVLVALALLGVSLATLLGVFGESLDRDRAIARRMAARTLAQSLLVQAETDPALVAGTKSGQSDEDLSWRITAEPISADGASSGLIKIDVSVQGESQNPVHLTTVRLAAKDPLP
jgi:general secretion pathway protein I